MQVSGAQRVGDSAPDSVARGVAEMDTARCSRWRTLHVSSTEPSSMTMTSYRCGADAKAALACSMNSGRFSASSLAGTRMLTSGRPATGCAPAPLNAAHRFAAN